MNDAGTLKLNRETLRALSDQEAGRLEGGWICTWVFASTAGLCDQTEANCYFYVR